MKFRTLWASALLVPSAAIAQTPQFANWQSSQRANDATEYKHSGGNAYIIARKMNVAGSNINDAIIYDFAKAIEGCAFTGGEEIARFLNNRVGRLLSRGGKFNCRIMVARDADTLHIMWSVALPNAGTDVDTVMDLLMLNALKIEAPKPPVQVAANNTPPSDNNITATKNQQALIAYANKIPAANRPVKMISRSSSSFSGWPPISTFTISIYMLFADGFATNCSDWDPAITAPKKEYMAEGCYSTRWRKTGSNYQLLASDGTWDGSDIADDYAVPKKGERMDLNFGNINSYGQSVGTMTAGTLSGSDLFMRSDGSIAVGKWASTNIAGPTVVGYSGGNDKPLIGQYYIDGNIIVLQDSDGTLSAGFITGVIDKGEWQHIYLNGTHYYD
jgi:hypothetical protein